MANKKESAKEVEKKAEEKKTTENISEKVEEVKDVDNTIVVRAKNTLKENEFRLLSDLIQEESKKTGQKIVLLPNSVEFAGDK